VVAGGRAARWLLLECALLDGVREVHDEADVDVGLEQRALDLLDHVVDVLLGDTGLPAEGVERAPQELPRSSSTIVERK